MKHDCNCPYCTSRGQWSATVSGQAAHKAKIEEFMPKVRGGPSAEERAGNVRAAAAKNYLQAIMVLMPAEARAQFMAEIMAFCEDVYVGEFGKALEAKRNNY